VSGCGGTISDDATAHQNVTPTSQDDTMIANLAQIKAKIDCDRDAFHEHLNHAGPDVLSKEADELAAYGKRLDDWYVYFEKWVPLQAELDAAWSNVPPLVVEYLEETSALCGLVMREGNENG
jgi:hypothetical protein